MEWSPATGSSGDAGPPPSRHEQLLEASDGPDLDDRTSERTGDIDTGTEPDLEIEAFLDDKRTEVDQQFPSWSSTDATSDRPGRRPGPETLSPEARHERYIDAAAGLFGEGGDYSALWDTERQNFDESAWAKLSMDERKKFAQRMEAIRADAFGQQPAPVDLVAMGKGSFGSYDFTYGDIQMNSYLTCEDSVRTIVHEGFHEYQATVIADETSTHPLRSEWADSHENYVSFEDDSDAYANQPLERDAFASEDRFLGALVDRLGTDER